MTKKDKVKDLESAIKEKEIQLSKLQKNVDKSNICSDLYNKIVLEKAILNKELKDIKNNSLSDKIKQLFPRKKTLICDYFKK